MPQKGFQNRQVRLSHAVGLLGAAADITDAVGIIRDHARVVAASDGITIVRRDGDEVEYLDEDAISPLWAGRRFPVQTCITGIAMLSGMPVLIPDIRNDNRVPMNLYLSTFVERLAVFPVGHRAAIGTYWREPGHIDQQTVDLMCELAEAAIPIFDPGTSGTRQTG